MNKMTVALLIASALLTPGCAANKTKSAPPNPLPPSVEFLGPGSDENAPKLRPAQVRVRHVDDQIKDGTFIPAHLEFDISEPARWESSK